MQAVPAGVRRRIAVLVVLVLSAALWISNPSRAQANTPEMGSRVLAIQASEAEGQSHLDAIGMVGGSGSTSQSVHTYWNTFETAPETYDFSLIQDLRDEYEGTGNSIKLRIDPIYTCSRTVPSDLATTGWDDSEMIERFKTVLDGVYASAHPVGGDPLDIDVLIIGTEVSSLLKLFGTDSASIDYYLKYKTFFDAVRTYAKTLWGSSLIVSSSSTWGKLVSEDAQAWSTDAQSVSADATTIAFTGGAPWGVANGDYVTIDYQGDEEIRKIAAGAGTTTWTLDTPLDSAHSAPFTVARTAANSVQTLNDTVDVVFYSYYGIDEGTLLAKDPYSAPYEDIYEAAVRYPNRTMGILEAGYPTDPEIGGSQAKQAAFISSMFGVWDQYCDDAACENPSLKYVDFQWATEWNEANLIQFTLGGCEGHIPPKVSTTATNAVSAAQNQVSFSTAPAYFSNGDTVYLLGPTPFSGIEEKAVIQSGAGTTTWTLTSNLKHSHDAGYEVLWHGPSSPLAGVYGSTGSTDYGYRISAVDNVDGTQFETLLSAEYVVANGPATLGEGNFVWVVWTAVPGADEYNVYRTTSGGSPSATGFIGTVSSNTMNDTGLTVSAHPTFTQNLFDFLGSIGYRTWEAGGTDKTAWGTLCNEAKDRGVSTTNC